ncbi:MAG TPA: pyridoxamine 5'-phosphate oxidase family protein [Bacillota bacterium]|nr:NimC/NimA family protein [Clostridiales bacterium]HPT84422.1 pyridoxamine 5'-phosphate oxidase family protein [Bacillota bacterium]
MQKAETSIETVCSLLKQCGTYYLATTDEDGKPRVRPFGTAHIFEGKLYIQTGNFKKVYRQLKNNPYVELSGMLDKSRWLRVEAKAVEDGRKEAKESMLEAYPELKSIYNTENTAVFYLTEVTATVCSFTEPPKVYKF